MKKADMKNLIAPPDRIIVSVKDDQSVSASGFILAEKHPKATVFSVDPDITWVKIGDEVLYTHADKLDLPGTTDKLMVVEVNNILAVIRNNNEKA